MSLWTGEFGNEYTKRNRESFPNARRSIWQMMLPENCESVVEIGANIGLNLDAISMVRPVELYACEPNELARQDLEDLMPATHITADFADKLSFPDGIADLAVICGVLIHIPPEKLLASMREIHRVARHWIVCAEYFSPTEEMVPYRGHKDALWRRDYGSLWLDNFPDLYCDSCLFTWKRMTGLDNLTWWVFEKGHRKN